jgi:hypothetical protein
LREAVLVDELGPVQDVVRVVERSGLARRRGSYRRVLRRVLCVHWHNRYQEGEDDY